MRMHRAREVMRHGTTTVAAAAARPRCCRRRADQRRGLGGESQLFRQSLGNETCEAPNETSETPMESRRTCLLIRESCRSVDEQTGCYYAPEACFGSQPPRLAGWGIMHGARRARRDGGQSAMRWAGAAQGVSQSPNAPEQRMPRSLRRKSRSRSLLITPPTYSPRGAPSWRRCAGRCAYQPRLRRHFERRRAATG